MSEYENALYQAVRVLGLAVVEMGGNRKAIQAGLEEMAEAMQQDNRQSGEAILRQLCKEIMGWTDTFVPRMPN